jgi:hypothetical protein
MDRRGATATTILPAFRFRDVRRRLDRLPPRIDATFAPQLLTIPKTSLQVLFLALVDATLNL